MGIVTRELQCQGTLQGYPQDTYHISNLTWFHRPNWNPKPGQVQSPFFFNLQGQWGTLVVSIIYKKSCIAGEVSHWTGQMVQLLSDDRPWGSSRPPSSNGHIGPASGPAAIGLNLFEKSFPAWPLGILIRRLMIKPSRVHAHTIARWRQRCGKSWRREIWAAFWVAKIQIVWDKSLRRLSLWISKFSVKFLLSSSKAKTIAPNYRHSSWFQTLTSIPI